MKVAVLTRSFGLPTETFIYNEVCEISQQVDLKLFTCQRNNEARFPLAQAEEIPFTQNRLRAKIQWELRKRDLYFSFHTPAYGRVLRSKIKSQNPSLIHAHFGPEAIRFWDNLNLSAEIPFIISFHGYDASRMLRSKAYIKRLQAICQKPNVSIICVSQYMRRQLAEAGVISPRTHILYYGTDCAFFQPQSPKPSSSIFTFLQTSSFREKKGHLYTIEAYAKFRQQNPDLKTQLILAGEGPLLEEIKAKTQQLGIANQTVFPGLVNLDQAKDLLQNADCFVHHSVMGSNGDQEGIPNAIMEAMAMELPVLSTEHAGIPELVESGVNGFLVVEKDIEAYANKMKEMTNWSHKPLNRVKVLQSFERKQHAASLKQIYQQSIASI